MGHVSRRLWSRHAKWFLGLVIALAFPAFGVTPKTVEHLVLVGGGSIPDGALKKFVEWSGKDRAHILVIAWAGELPEVTFLRMKDRLLPYSPATITAAPLATDMKKPAARVTFLKALSEATGVFFTGGEQIRIMEVLKDPAILRALRARYDEGVAFAGTSAGTAVMSPVMITGAGDFSVVNWRRVGTETGLGLLPHVILDQHFLKRRRENRLMGLVMHHDDMLGVGIDEDTALAVEDNRYAHVYGPTQVMFIDGHEQKGKLSLELLHAGETYDLVKRERISSPHSPHI